MERHRRADRHKHNKKPLFNSSAASQAETPARSPARTFLTILFYSLFFVLTTAIVFLFFAERWLFNTWAELSADEILYHMKASVDGTNPQMIQDALLKYGLPAALIILLIAAILFLLRKKTALRRAFTCLVLLVLCGMAVYLKTDLDRRINFTTYVKNAFSERGNTFIEDNYVYPQKVKLTFPKKKRNLIYIYLESMEMTYADKENGGAFERNIIPELTRLGHENEDFSGSSSKLDGGIVLPGTNWTMGAMFAHSTGLPLKLDIGGNAMANESSFFPKIQAIGDILEEKGYNQELLIGSKAKFGGRDVFYSGHGHYQINDLLYARDHGRVPKKYKEFWGYEDEKLFQFAKEDLETLAAKDEPFNLTMLTVDTHFEDGYQCRLCKDEFGEQYANAMACSSRQVDAFIEWLKEQDFYEDTTIILAGDHTTMDRDFCINVPDSYQRKTYVSIINGAASPADPDREREYSTFDLFPTTLSAMGVDIEGSRLGLGVDLYSDKDTLIEQYGTKRCSAELEMPSEFMKEISGIQITEDTLKEATEKIEIKPIDNPDGTTTLRMIGIHYVLNRKIIDKMELELKDKTTGESTLMETDPIYREDDPNKYYYDTIIDLKGKTTDDYDISYYVTVEDFKHYKVADNDQIEEPEED